jgi:RNA polymerase sigma-70 factor, ECF subfamily
MSDELPAEDLLIRAAQQDLDALGELYDRYAPRVYGLVTQILASREGAEEILQEVFMRLWSESPRLAQEGRSVAAWLVVTAREAAVGQLRTLRKRATNDGAQGPVAGKTINAPTRKSKTAVHPPTALKPGEGKSGAMKIRSADATGSVALRSTPTSWFPGPREITLIDDRLVLLTKVMDQLPKPQRQALELAVFGGLSEVEIATEMGEPLGKVRTSLRAAVTFIKHRRRAVCGSWAANI